jgi:C1A family cysteine protease
MSLPSYLTSSQRSKLHQLGIHTEAEFDGLMVANHEDTAKYLGLPLSFQSPAFMPGSFMDWFDIIAKELTARLDTPSWASPATVLHEKTPEYVNLIPICGPIQNQARRGTCVAFASVSALEAEFNKGKTNLSEQYMYYACKQEDGIPMQEGSWVSASFEKALPRHGFCKEELWKYNPDPGETPGQGPVPKEAVAAAKKNKPKKVTRLSATDVDTLKATLNKGKVIAMAVPVFSSWARNPEVARTGRIGMPIPGEGVIGGHAMAIVGYKNDGNSPGGGYFLIRNSWGTDWAKESTYGSGYATMPYAYMTQYGKEAYTVDL